MTDTTPRRTTYIDANTGTAETAPLATDPLQQTIAEARAAQVAELKSQVEEYREKYEAERLIAEKAHEALKTVQVELAEAKDALEAFTASTDNYEVTSYASEDDGATVIEIDTDAEIGALRVYLNDGLIWEGNPEIEEYRVTAKTVPEEGAKKGVAEEHPAGSFFRSVSALLEVHGNGPQAVLSQMESRTRSERALYFAQLDSVLEAMQRNVENLTDLRGQAQLAEAMLRS